jgi:hypothetical protein
MNACNQKPVLNNVDTAQIYSRREIFVLHPSVATPPKVEGNNLQIPCRRLAAVVPPDRNVALPLPRAYIGVKAKQRAAAYI